MQTAQRLDGFDAKEAGGKSGQVAGGNRQKKRGRSGVLAHADFVEGQRNHEQIEGVEKPCQEDSAMRRTTGGDLADDRILIYAIPLAQTHGQDLLLRNWIETTEQVDDDHCGSRWARAERVAQGMRGLRAEFLRELHEAIAFAPPYPAADLSGEVFGGGQRHAAEDRDQITGIFRQVEHLFEEIGNTVFQTDARAGRRPTPAATFRVIRERTSSAERQDSVDG